LFLFFGLPSCLFARVSGRLDRRTCRRKTEREGGVLEVQGNVTTGPQIGLAVKIAAAQKPITQQRNSAGTNTSTQEK
jgi:hypothetical protein